MDWLDDLSWLDRAVIGAMVAVVISSQIQTMLAVRSIDKNLANAINKFSKLIPPERSRYDDD